MLCTRKKRMREVSMYEKIGTDQEGRELRLMDVESPPLDILEDMEREQNLRHLSGCLERVLSGRELQVICENYGLLGHKERTQREIAKSWVSAARMCHGSRNGQWSGCGGVSAISWHIYKILHRRFQNGGGFCYLQLYPE